MRQYAAQPVRIALDSLLLGSRTKWDAVIYDGLHPAIHAAKAGKYRVSATAAPIMYRAHNREALIWERSARQTRSLLLQGLFTYQAILVRRFEDSLAEVAAGVACVSEEDLLLFRKYVPTLHAGVVRIGYDFESLPQVAPSGANQIVFLGRLDWPPNREGLAWFLDRVWPKVYALRKDLRLAVAGSGDASDLRQKLSSPGCTFLGRVENLEMLYQESLLCLVPVFYGGGTRVKAIEAARFGRACLSTAVGVEGLGLRPNETYYHAESAEAWIDTLVKLDAASAMKMGMQARSTLKERFSADVCAENFLKLLPSAPGSSSYGDY